MKKSEVRIGDVVAVMVSGRVSPVIVDGVRPRSHFSMERFTGRNLVTGRDISSFTAAKARFKMCGHREPGQVCTRNVHPEAFEHRFTTAAL